MIISMNKITKIIAPIIILISFVPSIAFAAWWNPLTWFGSRNTNATSTVSTMDQQLLEQVNELRQQVGNQQSQNIATTSIITSSVTSSSNLQTEINTLTAENSTLKSELATAQKNYSMCENSLASSQSSQPTPVAAPVSNTAPLPQSQPTQTDPKVTYYDNLQSVWQSFNNVGLSDYNIGMDDYNLNETYEAQSEFLIAKSVFDKNASDMTNLVLTYNSNSSIPETYVLAGQNMLNAAESCSSASQIMVNNSKSNSTTYVDASGESNACNQGGLDVNTFLNTTNP
jgi:hypothetical protein